MSDASPSVRLADDLWGGLAAALVALPASVAYGVVVLSAVGPEHAGAGALAGILGAAALGVTAPLVSRNGGFVSAPCAPAAAVLAGLAASRSAEGMPPGRVTSLLALTALLAALLQVLLGAVRAGRLIKYIPYQVVSGYLSGVALIIAIGQLPRLLGLPAGTGLLAGLAHPAEWRWPGVAVGAVTIVAMALAPRLVRAVPAAILGLAAGVATYFAFALARPGLLQSAANPLLIGPLPSASLAAAASQRLGALVALGPADVGLMLASAVTLAVLLSVDTLKTGVVLDALTRRRHDSNRELLGQGCGNLAATLAGGLPGAATLGPTLVNLSSGGRTVRSSVAEGLLVILAFTLCGRLLAWVPIGALAGILLVVSWRMFDFRMLRLLGRPSTRLDFAVIAAVVAVAATVGLIQAAAVGVGLAILLFIRDQVHGAVVLGRRTLRQVASSRVRLAAERRLLDAHGDEGVLVQLQGPLFFGTTDHLFSDIEPDLDRARYLLLDLRRVQSIDITAGQLLEQMRRRLEERGGRLLFSGMPTRLPTGQDLERYLGQLGLLDGGDGSRVFDTRDGALEWMEDRVLEGAGWRESTAERPLELVETELLAGLTAAEVGAVAAGVRVLDLSPGEALFRRGDEGDELFLVESGRVHVLLPLSGGRRHHLATICRGDFLGEVAFLDRGRRSADAEAATPVRVAVLSRAAFDRVVAADASLGVVVLERLARGLSHRLRTADAEVRALEER